MKPKKASRKPPGSYKKFQGRNPEIISLTNEFHFVPICVETMGVWGPKGYKFIKEVGKLISDETMERRSTSFLRQSISMEIQRGNCASILGTVESPTLLNELFELFDTKSDNYHT